MLPKIADASRIFGTSRRRSTGRIGFGESLSFFIGNAFYASHADNAMQPTEPPIARLLVGSLLHKVLRVAKIAAASHSNTIRVARPPPRQIRVFKQ
jgi:hypothetical protein